MTKRGRSLVAATILFAAVSGSRAGVVLTDNFNVDTSANYNVYVTAGAAAGPSSDATFAYDYGAAPASGGLSIPVAPHSGDSSTIGLRLRADNLQNASAAAVVGAVAVTTKNLAAMSQWTIAVDVWDNYIGNGTNISASGSNGTTGAALGVGTSGNQLQYIAANDGLLTEGFGDNGAGANQSYRLYLDNSHPNPTTANYWIAGTSGTSASSTDPYYTSRFPSVSAPSGQSSFLATQGGSTSAGTLGFAWHYWQIANDGNTINWYIDNNLITSVPVGAVTLAGNQFSLGNDDTGTGGNTAANNQLFNAHIFDNLVISDVAVPEPASLGLLGLAAMSLVRRRRAH